MKKKKKKQKQEEGGRLFFMPQLIPNPFWAGGRFLFISRCLCLFVRNR